MKASDNISDNDVDFPRKRDYGRADGCTFTAKSDRNPFYRLLPYLLFLCLSCFSIGAANIVDYTVSDSAPDSSEKLEIRFKSISNEDDKVRIIFELKNADTPFTIYKAEWINCDSVCMPIEPFSFIAQTEDASDKSKVWRISLDFPFSDSFDETDVLILNTDRGIVRCPTSRAGQVEAAVDIIRNDYEKRVDQSEKSSRKAWSVLASVLSCVVLTVCFAFLAVRRTFVAKRKEIKELSLLIAERSNRNSELESKVNALYGSRLDTLNMLCNEYFEKRESENIKFTVYNEVEKHILALRDSKTVAELEEIVNTYLDKILIRIKEQLPELNRKELIFLTYLYAGFSPRAVCIFTDMKIKNYYNRRSRLKERILASDAPDKEFFASKM